MQEIALTELTTPARQAVATAMVKQFLRVEHNEDDALVDMMIASATQAVEDLTHRTLASRTYRLHLDRFPAARACIVAPRPPLIAVASIEYVDTDGVTQTLAATEYKVVATRTPGEIVPAYGKSWPATRREPHAVTVEYSCGYGDQDDIPPPLVMAIMQTVADMYENRESFVTGTIATTLPFTAKNLAWPYRVFGIS